MWIGVFFDIHEIPFFLSLIDSIRVRLAIAFLVQILHKSSTIRGKAKEKSKTKEEAYSITREKNVVLVQMTVDSFTTEN